jgi:hypothetical protein
METPVLGFSFGFLVWAFVGAVQARVDGRYSNSPLKPWFDSLKSGKGLCCSFADGYVVTDPDWESKRGHYRGRIDNEWVDVPASYEAISCERYLDIGQGIARHFGGRVSREWRAVEKAHVRL